jgi:hypothetical protein
MVFSETTHTPLTGPAAVQEADATGVRVGYFLEFTADPKPGTPNAPTSSLQKKLDEYFELSHYLDAQGFTK